MTLESSKKMDKRCVLIWLMQIVHDPAVAFNTYSNSQQIEFAHDAIVLLKENEAVEPKRIDGKHNHFIKCGNCNTDLMSGMKYCPQCGKAVK